MSNKEKRSFDTLSQATTYYLEQGYAESFDTHEGKIINCTNKKTYQPTDLLIVEDYRFEGMSNPADNMILMIIEAKDGTKGTMINNMGGPDSNQDPEMVKQIPIVDAEKRE